jgi:hypothetical protein
VLAAVGSLAMVGGLVAVAAPASAAPTAVGTCEGQLLLVKFKPALTDQTQIGVKAAGGLAKNGGGTGSPIGGTCHNAAGTNAPPARPGDAHIPQPVTGPAGLPIVKVAASLLGNASCASGATAQAADGSAAFAWPLNGKITFTSSTTYTDLITNAVKAYSIPSDVAALGEDPSAAPDDIDFGGIVLAGGLIPGSTVSSQVWFNPVAKANGGPDPYNTGYGLDLANAAGCADGTANNATLGAVLVGGGAGTSTSVLGSTGIPGSSFSLGQ